MNLKCQWGEVKKDLFVVYWEKKAVKCCNFSEVVIRHICTVHNDCWNKFIKKGSLIMAESHDISFKDAVIKIN